MLSEYEDWMNWLPLIAGVLVLFYMIILIIRVEIKIARVAKEMHTTLSVLQSLSAAIGKVSIEVEDIKKRFESVFKKK